MSERPTVRIGNFSGYLGDRFTAIEEALLMAVTHAKTRKNKDALPRPFQVIFLTDGRPTIGETRPDKILERLAKATGEINKPVRVFSFGIGTDINTKLLDRIAEDTRAVTEYVLPEEDIEHKVSRFYTKISQPVLVQGEKYLYALMHTDQSPFALKPQGGTWEKANGVFRRNGKKIPVHWIGFLRSDPRIVAVPLHNDSKKKEFLDVKKPYALAKRPQDFPEAIIIHNGEAYGVVEFRIDPALGNYVSMDKPFLGGLFSKKFNPTRGDLVVSRTGMLLGIMVNNKYCLVIKDATPAGAILFGKNDSRGVAKILSKMQKLVTSKSFTLQ